jgi:hypothetical protein
MTVTEPRQTYTQEEVTEILKRALKQQSLRSQGLSHDQLVEMAKEVGIDQEAVEAATAELSQTRADELARQTEAHDLAVERSRLLGKFVSSFLTFLIVGVALFLINQKVGGATWYYWPLLGWGIGLAFQLRGVFSPEKSLERRKLEEWKRAEKLERRAARLERRRNLRDALRTGGASQIVHHGAKEFEEAVQAGVAALLSVAARKIHEHAGRKGSSPGRRTDRRL